jgi:hypothetical protein
LKTLRMSIAVLAATAALGAVPALAAEERNARAEGAPGYFCKKSGAEPGTTEFRECVRLAAKARGQAKNGDQEGGDPSERSRTAPGRFCQANGADPGSEAFRLCVRTAAKARRTARS